jgi:predicted Zn-dependent protease
MVMSSLKFFRLCILLAVAFIAHTQASAQNERDRDSYTNSSNSVEISGQVRFADNMQAAAKVSVRLERFGGGAFLEQMLTDTRGKFRFAGMPRGQYMVTVSAPCFAASTQQVELQVIFRSYLLFELRPEASAPNCRPEAAAAASVIDARVPAGARAEFERGRAALREKKLDEGLEHFQKAVGLYKDFYEAQFLIGTTHMGMRHWNDAEHALRRALELKPESAPALVSLGEVHRRQKRYPEAEKVLQAGLKHDDESWLGHFTLGRVYFEMNDLTRAAPHIGRTLQLKPDFAEAHLVGGNILLRLAYPERALLEYQEYLRLQPDGEYAPQAQELVGQIKKALAERK